MNRTLNRLVARFESTIFILKLVVALIIIYPVSWLFAVKDDQADEPVDVVHEG